MRLTRYVAQLWCFCHAAITSQPSTDSLDSLVVHEATHSAGKAAGHSGSGPSLDIEEALIHAAHVLLTSQARFLALCASGACNIETLFHQACIPCTDAAKL